VTVVVLTSITANLGNGRDMTKDLARRRRWQEIPACANRKSLQRFLRAMDSMTVDSRCRDSFTKTVFE